MFVGSGAAVKNQMLTELDWTKYNSNLGKIICILLFLPSVASLASHG